MQNRDITLDFVTLSVPGDCNVCCERDKKKRIIKIAWGCADYCRTAHLTVIATRNRHFARHVSQAHRLKTIEQFAAEYVRDYIGQLIGPAREAGADEALRDFAALDFEANDDLVEMSVYLRVWYYLRGRGEAFAILHYDAWLENMALRDEHLKKAQAVLETLVLR